MSRERWAKKYFKMCIYLWNNTYTNRWWFSFHGILWNLCSALILRITHFYKRLWECHTHLLAPFHQVWSQHRGPMLRILLAMINIIVSYLRAFYSNDSPEVGNKYNFPPKLYFRNTSLLTLTCREGVSSAQTAFIQCFHTQRDTGSIFTHSFSVLLTYPHTEVRLQICLHLTPEYFHDRDCLRKVRKKKNFGEEK